MADPDWGRFGLGDSNKEEKTKLTAVPDKSSYHGETSDSKHELFSDDQNSKAGPWWTKKLMVSERTLFGTWDGVFSSCMVNIIGVIIFLRSGWIVAQAGIVESCMIVVCATMLVLAAVVSAIGICSRCHVQSGGVYFLISHVLGARTGAAVGVIYVFGQSVGNALCATGFGESIAVLLGVAHSFWVERLVAAAVIIVLTMVNAGGVVWVIRLQFLLLILLALGSVDFALGSVTHRDPENGFYGWNSTIWNQNSHPHYENENNWFTVFGVFFPAMTGIMAGINMSGDLKNPSRDIAIGTLSALGTGSLLYLAFLLILGGTCTRAALLQDYMITEKVSAVGFFLLAALYISSASSCLATLFGTPRVLQSLANENVIPLIKPLGVGRGPNKVPVNALILISILSLVFILIGSFNRLATLSTLPFLITYAAIEYSHFSLCIQYDINKTLKAKLEKNTPQTPTFKEPNDGVTNESTEENGNGNAVTDLLEEDQLDKIEELPQHFYSFLCNPWFSLLGCALKGLVMFLVHWQYSLLYIIFGLFIWFYIGKTSPGLPPGIASNFSLIPFLKDRMRFVLGKRVDEGMEAHMVVTPMHPTIEVESERLTEENTDFSKRAKFHQHTAATPLLP